MRPHSPGSRAELTRVAIRKLEEVGQTMRSIATRKDLVDFLSNPENARNLNGLVEDIRHALIDYQVCIPKRPALLAPDVRLRLHYRGTSATRVAS